MNSDTIEFRRAIRRVMRQRRPTVQRAEKGYTVVVLVAAVVTALAFLGRELILVWPQ